MSDPLRQLTEAVTAAAAAVRDGGDELPSAPRLERPKREGQGDYSTNAAMLLAPVLGLAPRVIAERIGEELEVRLGAGLTRTEVAGPGFLNLFLADPWLRDALAAILAAGERFGSGGAVSRERVLIEFVSANPTGPLVAASGRHAAYGDALARIIEFHGNEVSREYYVNDAGSQVRRLGESVLARARGEEVPADGYQGEYVAELAAEIPDAAGRDPDELSKLAVQLLLEQIKATLGRYHVRFDTFFSELSLHEGSPSQLDEGLAEVERAGHTYKSEGAVWLRTTSFGDDKDRPLIRSNGEPTYLASDIAYLRNKLARGFDRLLLPVGADHSTYSRELKAVLAALGEDDGRLEVPLIQFVHLVESGERAAMSKRRGDFVTLDELLDEIGVDATRYFMVRSSADRTLDLDLDLAKRESRENPVYYIQYAHARIASMLRRLSDERVASALSGAAAWGSEPLHASERELIKKLASFGDEVVEAAARRAPHGIASYVLELAQDFTAFYRDCHVVGAEPQELESFRIALSVATQRVLARSLELLGVSAPDSM